MDPLTYPMKRALAELYLKRFFAESTYVTTISGLKARGLVTFSDEKCRYFITSAGIEIVDVLRKSQPSLFGVFGEEEAPARARCTCGALDFGGCFCQITLPEFLATSPRKRA